MKILAQIFGVAAMFFLFAIYQKDNRRGMLISKLSADVCWVVHYSLLGGIAGVIPNAVGIIRELVFINRKKHKWASLIVWPMLFILINWGLGFRTFYSWYNILPIIASTFVTISLWIDNPKLTKIITLPICTSFIIYDVFVCSYIGIINEAISIISILINLIKEKNKCIKFFQMTF